MKGGKIVPPCRYFCKGPKESQEVLSLLQPGVCANPSITGGGNGFDCTGAALGISWGSVSNHKKEGLRIGEGPSPAIRIQLSRRGAGQLKATDTLSVVEAQMSSRVSGHVSWEGFSVTDEEGPPPRTTSSWAPQKLEKASSKLSHNFILRSEL